LAIFLLTAKLFGTVLVQKNKKLDPKVKAMKVKEEKEKK